jgi:hypothetical protein
MISRLLPTLGLMGSVLVANVSFRHCIVSSYLPSEPDGGLPLESTCPLGSTEACNTYGTQSCVSAPGLTLSLGVWGPCSCLSAPVCTPGTSQTCGNCGTQVCDACGQAPACTNQGLCTPGDRGPDGCYEGEDAVCSQACEWVCP